jgi:hypothetical protein
MSISIPARRPLASVVAFAVVTAGLVLAPFTIAPASASDATDVTSLTKIVNKVENRSTAFLASPALTAWSKSVLAKIAKDYANRDVIADGIPVPGEVDAESGPGVDWVTVRLAKTATAAQLYAGLSVDTESPAVVKSADFNYAGVAVLATSKYKYGFIVVADYESAPLETITAATPKISGTAQAGKKLTAIVGAWKPSTGLDFSYQWIVAGEVRGTDSTYVPLPDVYNKTVTLKVSATKYGYAPSVVKTSAPTKKVAKGSFGLKGATAVGNRNVGADLYPQLDIALQVAVPGMTYDLTWYRGAKAVQHYDETDLTIPTYRQTAADRGKKIWYRVTFAAPGMVTATASSKQKAITDYPLISEPGTPIVEGDLVYGQTLTADPGTWAIDEPVVTATTITFTYQWYADNKAISGATKSTLKLGSATLGKAISVKVTGHASKYAATSVKLSREGTVATAQFSTAGAVEITGTFALGKTVTAVIDTPSSPVATSYTYQWFAGDTPISKATKSTFKLTQAAIDAGFVQVMVYPKKTGYESGPIWASLYPVVEG